MSTPTLITVECSDRRCTDGVTWCAACNGFGVLTSRGRKYQVRAALRNTISPKGKQHVDCDGTGLQPCGCRVLDAEGLASLSVPSEYSRTVDK